MDGWRIKAVRAETARHEISNPQYTLKLT